MRSFPRWAAARGLAYLALALASPTARAAYVQTNLVSDVPGLAPRLDPNLKNPWGVSMPPGGPLWVSNQVTGNATLYDGAGVQQALVVTIPNAGGASDKGPTGQVFNGTGSFALLTGGPATFIFANLDGTISGWNGAQGTTAQIRVLPPTPTVYTGLAIGSIGGSSFLYAADTRNGKIDVINGSFQRTTLPGAFADPNLPAGFTPYGIQNINGTIYVTYENESQGGGVVNAFDLNGNLIRRISANGAGGPLDDPWGVVLAPSTFGEFANKLLVGNEGDGRISAFDPLTGAFAGQLLDPSGNPIENEGLWGLTFGTFRGADPNRLYFVAGIQDEAHGLFGSIAAIVPEPSAAILMGMGGILLLGYRHRRPRSA